MNKGISAALPLIAIAVGLWLEGTILVTYMTQTDAYYRTSNEVTLFNIINSVEFSKQALSFDALKYSFYQASYEIIKNSGNSENKGVLEWRKYQQTFLPDYTKNLQDSTLKFLNQYVDVLQDPVTIPKYENVEVSSADSKVLVKATTSGKLEIKGENFEYSDSANLEEKIKINTLKIFEIGKENFITTDNVLNAIKEADQQMPDECKQINYQDNICRASCFVDTKALLEQFCGKDWETIFKDKIKTELDKLKTASNGITTNLEYSDIKVDYKATCSACKQIESCGIVSGLATYKWESDCTYDYFGAAKVLVKITDKDKYPVYDGTTDMRNLELKFYVVSGNKELI